MIKHVTIDLWMTLIRSHPSYKKERVLKVHTLLHEFAGYKGSPNAIQAAIKGVDEYHTMVCEKTGYHNMNQRDLWFMVMYHLNIHEKVTLEQVDLIISQCNELFGLYPPEFIDKDTIPILKEVMGLGASIDIISNTGFITAGTLKRMFLDKLLGKIVRKMYFSDTLIWAKPNTDIFQASLRSAREGGNRDIQPSNVLHVGDNIIADIKGAKQAGFNTMWVNCGPEGDKLNQLPDYIRLLNTNS